MTDHRFIIEMGMGNDLYGEDMTKAAARAIQDAIRHSSIPMFDVLGISHDHMRVQVTVGVPDPQSVDTAALAKTLPRGNVAVTATKGGHRSHNPQTGQTITIATAAVEAFLPTPLYSLLS
ncbi:Lin0512 family protein [Nereida sp. MMG025]|uniref:Lin0512 family protein n=1 Tax=Nereida sp. MMG025 TaxID=2909981 RepID=UPI001F331703|nr:Lin0512 family protein [Nereida sp. MMG025]MCF6444894.1 Lin0512 family protein [Nereida sp. MMG025]